jgi:uncharacterized membrane protein
VRAGPELRLSGVARALLVFAVVGLPAAPAMAEFKVCNQTVNLFNLAVGYFVPETGGYETEGWWTVAANSCATLIKQPLSSRYVFVYGTDIHGEPAVSGTEPMCVDTRRFKIAGVDECWVRGFEQAQFLEVDTGNAETWTFFIREP